MPSSKGHEVSTPVEGSDRGLYGQLDLQDYIPNIWYMEMPSFATPSIWKWDFSPLCIQYPFQKQNVTPRLVRNFLTWPLFLIRGHGDGQVEREPLGSVYLGTFTPQEAERCYQKLGNIEYLGKRLTSVGSWVTPLLHLYWSSVPRWNRWNGRWLAQGRSILRKLQNEGRGWEQPLRM